MVRKLLKKTGVKMVDLLKLKVLFKQKKLWIAYYRVRVEVWNYTLTTK
mgnify:CR=1 FL=1